MLNKLFLRRLRKELPRWVEQGWVDRAHQKAILDDAATQAASVQRAALVMAVLGVLVFGAGVIAFFAANWGEIPKLVKLIVLFGAMWGAYALAGRFVIGRDGSDARFGHAFLFLGLILYGANIFLIGQIYHIDAHYPDGVFFWALGAVVLVYAVPSQTIAIAGLVLTYAWTLLETSFDIFAISKTGWYAHWPFIVVWALFLPVVVRRQWRPTAVIATLAFLLWSAETLGVSGYRTKTEPLHAMAAAFLTYLTVYLLGATLERVPRLTIFSSTVRNQSALFGLAAFYGLSLRMVHQLGRYAETVGPVASDWLILVAILSVLVLGLAAWLCFRGGKEARFGYLTWGYGLLVLTILAIFAGLLLTDKPALRTPIYIAFNLLFFATIVWLIYAGYRAGSAFQVNLGFAFFTIGLLKLYFDTFWGLMDRSFFFMIGGVILIGGGYLLDRQRRRLMRDMSGEGGTEAKP